MKTFLFFAYRDWAVNIFRRLSQEGDRWILMTKESECDEDFINKIQPDIIFFYGWSWLIQGSIINTYPCLCLHPSPLPKYRGGSPIQNQVIAGEETSAVTIFKMNEVTDSGNILFQSGFSLEGTLNDIFCRIEDWGVIGTRHILDSWTWDYVRGVEQDHKQATFYFRRSPQQSEIHLNDFANNDAKYFYNMVRCLQSPYPEAYIKCNKGKLILEKVRYEL